MAAAYTPLFRALLRRGRNLSIWQHWLSRHSASLRHLYLPTTYKCGNHVNNHVSHAYHSEAMPPSIQPTMLLSYQDIVDGTDNKSIILIDVREPQELKETAVLPTSINIPLNDLKAALESLSPEEFKGKYDIPLPDKAAPLVFTCRSGNRSMKALLIALELGYMNSKHYTGGYLDWVKQRKF